MAHPELLSSLYEKEIRKFKVAKSFLLCFQKATALATFYCVCFYKNSFKKNRMHAYHYVNKTSTGQMNSIELEKNKICSEWWMILVFNRELLKNRPNAEDIFAVFNL